ncbi:SGNH/GDSL hydrolase family protein [Roseibium algicola]|uniref:SGNH/GDSL hydrolase family protein n=1 Tax=Roseibium algicola TaxID=2857014 RepID=UPI003457FC21
MHFFGRHRRIATILCLIPAGYFLLTAIFALVHFDDFASDLPRLLRYVLGPLAIAALLVGCAWLLSPDNALTMGITACSILAGMFMFEGYMRWHNLPQRMGLAGIVDGGTDLERYGGAMPPAYTIKALNAKLGTETLAEAVLAGTPGAEMLLCSRMGVPVTTRIDSYGFRNPQPKTAAPVDLMILGDSFAEGICLDDGQHFVDQMRAGGASILNTASRGAGPLYELAVLGRYGPHFRPRITVLAFFEGNDWENLSVETEQPWLHEALAPEADFGPIELDAARRADATRIITGWWQGTAATLEEYLSRRAYLRNFLALQETASILGLHYPKAASDNPVFEQILHRMKQIADGWQGRVVVVYIPALDQFGGVFPHGFLSAPLRENVARAAESAGLGLIDLTPTFRDYPSPLGLYAPDAHLNAEGAALAAGTIMADPLMTLP